MKNLAIIVKIINILFILATIGVLYVNIMAYVNDVSLSNTQIFINIMYIITWGVKIYSDKRKKNHRK